MSNAMTAKIGGKEIKTQVDAITCFQICERNVNHIAAAIGKTAGDAVFKLHDHSCLVPKMSKKNREKVQELLGKALLKYMPKGRKRPFAGSYADHASDEDVDENDKVAYTTRKVNRKARMAPSSGGGAASSPGASSSVVELDRDDAVSSLMSLHFAD